MKEARNKFLELAKAGKLSVKDVAEGGVFDKGIVEGMKSLNIDLPSSDGTAGSKNNDTNESENVSGSDKNNRSSSSISNSSSSRDGNASITAEEGDAALLSRYRLRTSLLDYLRDAEALIMVIADLCNYVRFWCFFFFVLDNWVFQHRKNRNQCQVLGIPVYL